MRKTDVEMIKVIAEILETVNKQSYNLKSSQEKKS